MKTKLKTDEIIHNKIRIFTSKSFLSLPKTLQESAYKIAEIVSSYLPIKKIHLKVGEDSFPEVNVKINSNISSKELIKRLEVISEVVWNLSDENPELLYISIIVNRA